MSEGWPTNRGKPGLAATAEGTQHDIAVREPSTWAIRVAIVASCAALLGTEKDDPAGPPRYSFEKQLAAPLVELTGDAPSAEFWVFVTADALGPNMEETTLEVKASVSGSIGGTSAVGEVPEVLVQLGNEDLLTSEPAVSEAKQFSLERPIDFLGNCSQPSEDDPCTSSFVVRLSRSDGGEAGGILRVTWDVSLKSQLFYRYKPNDEPNGPQEAPWQIVLTPR